MEGLDLRAPFVQSKGGVYDLYGVCNHFGNLKKGHYTAFVKNVVSGRWYTFDDSKVTEMESKQCVTKNAYVLFY